MSSKAKQQSIDWTLGSQASKAPNITVPWTGSTNVDTRGSSYNQHDCPAWIYMFCSPSTVVAVPIAAHWSPVAVNLVYTSKQSKQIETAMPLLRILWKPASQRAKHLGTQCTTRHVQLLFTVLLFDGQAFVQRDIIKAMSQENERYDYKYIYISKIRSHSTRQLWRTEKMEHNTLLQWPALKEMDHSEILVTFVIFCFLNFSIQVSVVVDIEDIWTGSSYLLTFAGPTCYHGNMYF